MNKARKNKASRAMKFVLVSVIFVGLFFQIGMLAQISDRAKQTDSVSAQIVQLSAYSDNLEVQLSQLKNPQRIETLALGLGMRTPQEGDIRVLSLPGISNTAYTQTVQVMGTEGVHQ